jgi:hypothetical protein
VRCRLSRWSVPWLRHVGAWDSVSTPPYLAITPPRRDGLLASSPVPSPTDTRIHSSSICNMDSHDASPLGLRWSRSTGQFERITLPRLLVLVHHDLPCDPPALLCPWSRAQRRGVHGRGGRSALWVVEGRGRPRNCAPTNGIVAGPTRAVSRRRSHLDASNSSASRRGSALQYCRQQMRVKRHSDPRRARSTLKDEIDENCSCSSSVLRCRNEYAAVTLELTVCE